MQIPRCDGRPQKVLLIGFQDQDNLGLRYLMSTVNASGHEAFIMTYRSDPDKILQRIRQDEPDVVGFDKKTGEYVFNDCSAESPKDRRSFCYDREALKARKEHKPANSAVDMAAAMGVELLSEEQYRELQKVGELDTKTSSWIRTPSHIRKLGGALFCDRRYDTVFVYHNGAESYYAARAFRGSLKV